MRFRKRSLTVCAMAGLLVPRPGQAQQPTVAVKFETQFQGSTTSVDAAGGSRQPASTFEFRRVRVFFDIRINDWITGAVEPDLAMGRLSTRKVFVDFALTESFGLKFGQDKKPFSLIELTSSSKIPVIETGARIRGLAGALQKDDASGLTLFRGQPLIPDEQTLLDQLLYKGYELGVTAHGQFGGLNYEAGIYNGTGIDQIDDNAGKSLAGRVTYGRSDGRPLRAGVAASLREVNFPSAADTATRSGTAYSVDLEWGGFRVPGFWLLAEVTTGSNLATEDRFNGGMAVLTYFHATKGRVEGVEPLFRVGVADPNDARANDEAVMLTPGVNLYFTGRNKASVNVELFRPRGSQYRSQNAVRAQVQLYM